MRDPLHRPITRRQLLRRAAAGGAALSVPSLLAACGGGNGIEGQEAAPDETTTQIERELAPTLVFANWPLYIDIDEETRERPTLEQFEEEFGVRVRYLEEVNDNNEWFARMQPALSEGQPAGRDIAVLTDWMAARFIRLGWVEALDRESIPNRENLVEALESPAFDEDRTYTLPWQSGMTGIGYDPELTGGEVNSIDQLLEDSNLRGRVALLSEMGDTIGLVALANGDDPEQLSEDSFNAAVERIQEAVDSGQIRQFTGNEYSGLLSRGDLAACLAWSGDIVQLQFDNPRLEFTLPESGGMIWTDNMLIPRGGEVYTASVFMDFVYRPEIAAQIAEYVNFISPVEGAREEMEERDPEIAENPLIFPPEEVLAQTHIFDADAYENEDFRQSFEALLGA